MLAHGLIQRFPKQRFELFLTSPLAMFPSLLAIYSGFGVLLPLGLYVWVLRSPWLLAAIAIGVAGCVVLGVALRLARRGEYQQSITLVCIGNWAAVLFATFVAPNLLPVWVLAALLPVIFAQ